MPRTRLENGTIRQLCRNCSPDWNGIFVDGQDVASGSREPVRIGPDIDEELKYVTVPTTAACEARERRGDRLERAHHDVVLAASASEKETTRPSSVSLLRHWMQPSTDFSSPDSSTYSTPSMFGSSTSRVSRRVACDSPPRPTPGSPSLRAIADYGGDARRVRERSRSTTTVRVARRLRGGPRQVRARLLRARGDAAAPGGTPERRSTKCEPSV